MPWTGEQQDAYYGALGARKDALEEIIDSAKIHADSLIRDLDNPLLAPLFEPTRKRLEVISSLLDLESYEEDDLPNCDQLYPCPVCGLVECTCPPREFDRKTEALFGDNSNGQFGLVDVAERVYEYFKEREVFCMPSLNADEEELFDALKAQLELHGVDLSVYEPEGANEE